MLSAGLFQLLNLRALGVKRNAIRLSEMTGRVVGKSTITESLLAWPNDGKDCLGFGLCRLKRQALSIKMLTERGH